MGNVLGDNMKEIIESINKWFSGKARQQKIDYEIKCRSTAIKNDLRKKKKIEDDISRLKNEIQCLEKARLVGN